MAIPRNQAPIAVSLPYTTAPLVSWSHYSAHVVSHFLTLREKPEETEGGPVVSLSTAERPERTTPWGKAPFSQSRVQDAVG